MWEVLPGQWEFPPRFDADGIPQQLLSRRLTRHPDAADDVDITDPSSNNYERLRSAVHGAGVRRPRAKRSGTRWSTDDVDVGY